MQLLDEKRVSKSVMRKADVNWKTVSLRIWDVANIKSIVVEIGDPYIQDVAVNVPGFPAHLIWPHLNQMLQVLRFQAGLFG